MKPIYLLVFATTQVVSCNHTQGIAGEPSAAQKSDRVSLTTLSPDAGAKLSAFDEARMSFEGQGPAEAWGAEFERVVDFQVSRLLDAPEFRGVHVASPAHCRELTCMIELVDTLGIGPNVRKRLQDGVVWDVRQAMSGVGSIKGVDGFTVLTTSQRTSTGTVYRYYYRVKRRQAAGP